MRLTDKQLNPTLPTLRQFGGLSFLFLAYGAYVQGFVRHQETVAVTFAAAAVIISMLALTKPSLIKPIFVGAMIVTFPIGWVVSHLLLGLMYYGILTPIACIFRMIGRDALFLKPQSETKTTYWLPKEISTDPKRYFRMY